MKKLVTVSLFIFLAIVAGVIIIGLFSFWGNSQTFINPNTNGINSIGKITGVSPNVATLTLSKTELAKHNSSSSCWLLISGKIYDVTTFLAQHPGGEGNILSTCGTDATVAFDTKGRPNGSSHSGNATAMLANYFIGNLNQTLTLRSGKTTAPVPIGNKTNTNSTISKTPPIVPNTTLALTSTELAKHNSAQSCWLLISGKIYDVTTFLNQHPGNASTILPSCGTDATVAFDTKGGRGSHSSSAFAMLADYYIGDFNQTVNTSPTNPTTPPVANPNPTQPRSRGGDDD